MIGAAFEAWRKARAVCLRAYHLGRFGRAGRGVAIGEGFAAYAPERIRLGDGVSIGRHVTLRALTVYPWTSPPQHFEPRIDIGDGAFISNFSQVSAAGRVEIGARVMIAEGCFITDNGHGYEDPARPVKEQPLRVAGDVRIGDDAWIGAHACVLGGVTIGRHCVVGAHAVVNRSLPDFCVAAGAPARVIKRYDPDLGRWRRTDADGTFAPDRP